MKIFVQYLKRLEGLQNFLFDLKSIENTKNIHNFPENLSIMTILQIILYNYILNGLAACSMQICDIGDAHKILLMLSFNFYHSLKRQNL